MNCGDCPFRQKDDLGYQCLWASCGANWARVDVDEETCKRCLASQSKMKRHWKRKRKDAKWNDRPPALNWMIAKKLKEVFGYQTPLKDIFSCVKNQRHIAHERISELLFFKEKQIKDFSKLCEKHISDCEIRREFLNIGIADAEGEQDRDQRNDYLQSLNRKMDVGQLLFDTKYPVFCDALINDTPKPKKKNCVLTVVAGKHYEEMFDSFLNSYERYAKKCNADFVLLKGRTQGWWGHEKFRVKPFVEAYDRTVFLDSDIVIKNPESAPDLFELVPEDHVGMHDDYPLSASRTVNVGDWHFEYWRVFEREFLIRSQDPNHTFNRDDCASLFNTGVVVTSRQHADIWEPMYKPIPRNHCDEQFWVEHLALTKHPNKICRLPLDMNLQHWMDCFDKVAPFAHFLHLALAGKHTVENKKKVIKEVRERYADKR